MVTVTRRGLRSGILNPVTVWQVLLLIGCVAGAFLGLVLIADWWRDRRR